MISGISIVLAINSWNEQKRLQEEETKLLELFKKEEEDNIAFLERKWISHGANEIPMLIE